MINRIVKWVCLYGNLEWIKVTFLESEEKSGYFKKWYWYGWLTIQDN